MIIPKEVQDMIDVMDIPDEAFNRVWDVAIKSYKYVVREAVNDILECDGSFQCGEDGVLCGGCYSRKELKERLGL